MMNDDAWERASDLAKKNAGDGVYLALNDDGETAVVAFCGDPQAREAVRGD